MFGRPIGLGKEVLNLEIEASYRKLLMFFLDKLPLPMVF